MKKEKYLKQLKQQELEWDAGRDQHDADSDLFDLDSDQQLSDAASDCDRDEDAVEDAGVQSEYQNNTFRTKGDTKVRSTPVSSSHSNTIDHSPARPSEHSDVSKVPSELGFYTVRESIELFAWTCVLSMLLLP